MKNNIVIISSGQPFGNPRMVKEACAFLKMGCNVTVVYSSLNPNYVEFDKLITNQFPMIGWIDVSSKFKSGNFNYFRIKLRRKIWEVIYKFLGNICDSAVKSLVLYSQELKEAASKFKADLFIGHNLGALPAVVYASKINYSLSSFDFEDYHRGESIQSDFHSVRIKVIEDKYVPLLNFATCASPLIKIEYKNLYPDLSIKTINNCFPFFYRDNRISISNFSKDLKIFWCSQFVGKERGLEDIINAIGVVNDSRIKLSLLGNIDDKLKDYFIQLAIKNNLEEQQLIFIDLVPEHKLVEIGQQHHIGLASESLHQKNRDLCLTNKIFIYLLSKNAILFSNTKAQSQFLNQYPGIGFLYNQGDIYQIAVYLRKYLDNPHELEHQRNKSEQLGQILNWENECVKLFQFYNFL